MPGCFFQGGMVYGYFLSRTVLFSTLTLFTCLYLFTNLGTLFTCNWSNVYFLHIVKWSAKVAYSWLWQNLQKPLSVMKKDKIVFVTKWVLVTSSIWMNNFGCGPGKLFAEFSWHPLNGCCASALPAKPQTVS